MAGGPTLRTERLELRPFDDPDVPALHRLFTDEEVRRYLLDGAVVSEEWVESEVRESAARFAGGSAGLWTIREAAEAGDFEVIGFVGFRPFFDPPELQLLYGLAPDRWGRGLVTEAARAAVEYAFDTLGLEEVRAATDVPNEASVAVLGRLGMEEDRRTDDGEHGTTFFRLRRGRWQGGTS